MGAQRMIEFLRNVFDLLAVTLTTFHGWDAPWWLSIVVLTLVVRTLLFPLTFRQVKSMRKMQELKPELDEIRESYKDDPQQQQQEQMKLYGERGINPLGGCLPIFVQLPIFIVLYQTIKQFEHLESFRTGGLLWFQNLTVADPYFILPVAYVLTMMASQELTIRRTDPQQKQIMRFLPLAFGFFLFRFPAALFVYWVTSNVITFAQNLIVYGTPPRSTDREDAPPDSPKPAAEGAPRAGEDASHTEAGSKAGGTPLRSKRRSKKKPGKRR